MKQRSLMENTNQNIEEILQVAIQDYQRSIASLDTYFQHNMSIPLHVLKELAVINECAAVAYRVKRKLKTFQEDELPRLKAILESQRTSALERGSGEAVIALYDDLISHF